MGSTLKLFLLSRGNVLQNNVNSYQQVDGIIFCVILKIL